MSTFDQIMGADDLGEFEVEVPEWGVTVKLRGLTRGELMRINDGDPPADVVNARALAAAMLEPKLTVDQATELLDKKGMRATKRLQDKVMEVSGLSDQFPAGQEG